jgi:hypothetical protein
MALGTEQIVSPKNIPTFSESSCTGKQSIHTHFMARSSEITKALPPQMMCRFVCLFALWTEGGRSGHLEFFLKIKHTFPETQLYLYLFYNVV